MSTNRSCADFIVDEDGNCRIAKFEAFKPELSPIVIAATTLSPTTWLDRILRGRSGPDADDTEALRQIIIEGRKQDVDEFEFEVRRKTRTGLDLSGLQGLGANVSVGTESETHYRLKVRYK